MAGRPCETCPDNFNGKREWGVCGDGFGICSACLDYYKQQREAKTKQTTTSKRKEKSK